MRPQVYIPSRGRSQVARQLTRDWFKEGFDTYWVVEPAEYNDYADVIVAGGPINGPHDNAKVFVMALPMSNQGIGFSRNHCVKLAKQSGQKSIILADDDIKPSAKGGRMMLLINFALNPKVLGVTARYSYHDLCLGPDIKHMEGPILLPTGTFRLVGLNVDNVIKIGSYDVDLEYAEDCDLFLRGIKEGFPWMVHLDTWANSIGTRYQPGGMLDFAGGKKLLTERKEWWHDDIYNQWPDFVNEHDYNKCKGKQNCIRIQWKKAYNTMMPGWQSYSDLHGGSIDEYLDA